MEGSKIWQNLDAVKGGRTMSYEQVGWMHRDPITLNAQLQSFIDFFQGIRDRQE